MAKTIEEILPYYLGTGLKCLYKDEGIVLTMNATGAGCDNISIYDVEEYSTPMLRKFSLENLTAKIVTYSGSNISILDYISTSKKDSQLNCRLLLDSKADQLEFWKVERLIQFHFNVFNLPSDKFVEIDDKQSILKLREEV